MCIINCMLRERRRGSRGAAQTVVMPWRASYLTPRASKWSNVTDTENRYWAENIWLVGKVNI